MDEGGDGDEAVLDRHSTAGAAKTGERPHPPQTRLQLPRQTLEAPNTLGEPTLEPGATLALWQEENAEPDLAEGDRVDDLAFVTPEPLDDSPVRR